MMTTKPFDAAVLQDDILGEVIELRYSSGNPDSDISLRISPTYGSNLYEYKYGSYNLMYCDKEKLARHGFAGCFVLWPFPNRVAGRKYSFNGIEYSLKDVSIPSGNEVLVHGLVRDRAWEYSTPKISENEVSVTTTVEMNESSPYFSDYPFQSALSLTYTLTKEGVKVSYEIENKDSKEMPFGFALHPGFSTLISGMNETLVSLQSNSVEETDTDLLPTGKKLDLNTVMYQQFSLKTPKAAGTLQLDHIYTDTPEGESFVVDHTKQKMRIKISHSRDILYNIIYTMEADKFICLEPQTCITNAINMDHKKYNLLSVKPGEKHTGFIAYAVEQY